MSEELKPPRFPTMLRKMWSGGEVQEWIDENWNRRAAQPEPEKLRGGFGLGIGNTFATRECCTIWTKMFFLSRFTQCHQSNEKKLTYLQCKRQHKCYGTEPQNNERTAMIDAAYQQLMKHAHRLAMDGHDELAQHLRNAVEEARAPTVVEPVDDVAYHELTDAECDEFRRHRGDFNSMLRSVHSDGHHRHAGSLIAHLGAVFNERFDRAIAATPPRAALTDEQIEALAAHHGDYRADPRGDTFIFNGERRGEYTMLAFARAVEAAHGIGAAQ